MRTTANVSFSPCNAHHFMGISTSVCNNTHRTCNAQQHRMAFRQNRLAECECAIKSEILGTHRNNLTAKMSMADSANTEIHLFVLRSPSHTNGFVLVAACECNDSALALSPRRNNRCHGFDFIFLRAHTKQSRTGRPNKNRREKKTKSENEWASPTRAHIHTYDTIRRCGYRLSFFVVFEPTEKLFRLISFALSCNTEYNSRLSHTHTHTHPHRMQIPLSLFQPDIFDFFFIVRVLLFNMRALYEHMEFVIHT